MEEKNRLSRMASGVMLTLALCAVSCGAQSPSGEASPPTVAASETSADSDAIQAAAARVRAFFAVKGRAEDPLSVQIDKQADHLTARDVHPSSAYETGMNDRPSGITDSEVTVELSNSRWIDDDIQVDFIVESIGVSYPMIGEKLQLGEGTPLESHWEGTATLENRNGEWLINDLTVDSFGGRVD